MAKFHELKPMVAALGVTFAVSLAASSVAHAAENPFSIKQFETGYSLTEAKCGGDKGAEAKCGGDKGAEAKDPEGKCGGDKGAEVEKSATEGKCGEAKCGAGK